VASFTSGGLTGSGGLRGPELKPVCIGGGVIGGLAPGFDVTLTVPSLMLRRCIALRSLMRLMSLTTALRAACDGLGFPREGESGRSGGPETVVGAMADCDEPRLLGCSRETVPETVPVKTEGAFRFECGVPE
jgi:hypothetical protein